MMFNRFYNMEMKNTSASAPSANAGSSCAHTACTSHTANTAMIAIMDAIIMASFIILSLHGILGDCSENRRARHHRLRRTQTPAPV